MLTHACKVWSDPDFRKAKAMAVRAFEDLENLQAEVDLSGSKIFRKEGGGRKTQVPEIRDRLFGKFIDVRAVLKGRVQLIMEFY